jgi:zinc protease
LITRRRILPAVALALTICCAMQPVLGQRGSASAIKIPFETYKLPNGLTVILSVDRAIPTVAVNVTYHVGSKNEMPGRTGFAHLFEHVMFTGSGHIPYGTHDRLTEGVGGNNNGSTNNDRTNYFETVPANYLETALWLESDRMGFLLDTLDLGKLNAQRDIVKNERRQSYDNQPYGRVSEIFAAAMYPKTHPYSWPVIGSMTDLSAASEEDVKAFFRLYYAPNNATLAVVGDFNPVEAKKLIAKYFGDLPKGEAVQRPSVPLGNLEAAKRLVYEDRVQVPRLYIQWPTVGFKRDDDYPLSVMSSILSGSRTARLTKALVYDSQIASQVGAFQNSAEDVGVFQVVVTPRPGHTLTELEAAVDQVVQKFVAEGPTAEELQKAKNGLELQFLRGLESNLGKANQLIAGSIFYNNPAQFRTDYQKTLAVTATDVKRVASLYLARPRIVLSVVPKGKKDQASKATESEVVSGLLRTGVENQRGGR